MKYRGLSYRYRTHSRAVGYAQKHGITEWAMLGDYDPIERLILTLFILEIL